MAVRLHVCEKLLRVVTVVRNRFIAVRDLRDPLPFIRWGQNMVVGCRGRKIWVRPLHHLENMSGRQIALYLKRVSSARVRSEVVALYRSVRTATQISPDFIPGVDSPSAIFPAEKSITEVAIRRSRTIFRGRGKTSSGRDSPECRSVDMNFLNASWIVRPHSVIQALPGGFPKGADFLVEAMTE